MDYNLFKEELLLAIQDLADPEQSKPTVGGTA